MRRTVAVVVWFLVSLVVFAPTAAATPDDAGRGGATDTTIVENEFIPAERDLTDCVSALPKPGCGSEARGGPYQAAVFGAVVLGLGVIATRIVIGVRRRDAAVGAATEQPTAQR